MTRYTEVMEVKQLKHGDKFSDEFIAKQFIPYFNNRARIEVDFGDGLTKRGTVGITTGWKPCFLLMLRRNSMGSAYTLNANDKIIKIIS